MVWNFLATARALTAWLLRDHMTYNNAGTHNPERASSMRSRQDIFIASLFLKRFLVRILNIF